MLLRCNVCAIPVRVCQLDLYDVAGAKWLGCAIGMASGCLLGLTPLLFYGHSEASHGSSSSSTKHQPAAAT